MCDDVLENISWAFLSNTIQITIFSPFEKRLFSTCIKWPNLNTVISFVKNSNSLPAKKNYVSDYVFLKMNNYIIIYIPINNIVINIFRCFEKRLFSAYTTWQNLNTSSHHVCKDHHYNYNFQHWVLLWQARTGQSLAMCPIPAPTQIYQLAILFDFVATDSHSFHFSNRKTNQMSWGFDITCSKLHWCYPKLSVDFLTSNGKRCVLSFFT